jgi:hypothetical protein
MTNGAKPVPRIIFLAKETFDDTGFTSFFSRSGYCELVARRLNLSEVNLPDWVI